MARWKVFDLVRHVHTNMIHPAILVLLRAQSRGAVKRMLRGFATPRRFVLSSLGVVLAMVWLGNVLISVLFRAPMPDGRFRMLATGGLVIYTLWHAIKAAFARPAKGIDWTPAEEEALCGAPLRRLDLLAYRFAGIFNAGILKAACFTLVMSPDIRVPWAGFLGFLMALVFVDLSRMIVEITCWGAQRENYLRYRVAVVVVLVGVVASMLTIAICQPTAWQTVKSVGLIGLLPTLLATLRDLGDTLLGRVCQAPFGVFANVIMTPGYGLQWAASLAGSVTIISGMIWAVVRLDRYYIVETVRREMRNYSPTMLADYKTAEAQIRFREVRTPRGAGIGALAWRQGLGAHGYLPSLLLSLSIPSVLAMLPVLTGGEPMTVVLHIVAALVFYSFLLLPTALKFDFRRDLDRMVVLKSLPLSPAQVVIGQLATPVLISTAYQVGVLLLAILVRPLPMVWVAAAVLLLIPLNILIFALDNLIFLWYPYRLNQEGITVFLRTTLTFTAKGLLFGLALAVAAAWAFGAKLISVLWSDLVGWGPSSAVIFSAGLTVLIAAAAGGGMVMLTRAFRRFDVTWEMQV